MSKRFDPTSMKATKQGIYNPMIWVAGVIAAVFVIMIIASLWDRGHQDFRDSVMDHRIDRSDSVNATGGDAH